MAYTVEFAYNKILDSIDKIGSDLITLENVMGRFSVATYDFIGESVKFIDNTQEIHDDIRTLYVPFTFPIVDIASGNPNQDPIDSYGIRGIAWPSNYMHLASARVVGGTTPVRDTRIVRAGQEEPYLINPNRKPTAEYPMLVRYDSYLKYYSPDNENRSIQGWYIKKPTIWQYNETDDLDSVTIVDLPDHSVEKIMQTVASAILVTLGDPRSPIQIPERENYRQR